MTRQRDNILLVTGGAGFIGSNFIRYILRERPDWHVINLDKLTYAGNVENLQDVEGHTCYRFVRGDICDRALVHALLAGEHPQTNPLRPNIIVNFAAESHVDRSILDASPFVETNVLGTQVLLEAARTLWLGVRTADPKPTLFVQISTDEVYGSIEVGSFTEESPLHPNSPYAASKASADLLCRAYHRTYGLPVIITRSSNNYGPYQFPEKLIPLMIQNALEGKPLPVYGKGENVRDWLYVEDNCRALLMVIEKGRAGEIYNIGGSCERRNIEVVQLLCEILRSHPRTRRLKPEIQFVQDRPGHDFRYSLDSTKIQRELGWVPSTSLEAGLNKTVEWYLDHQDWVRRILTSEYREYYARVYEKGWR
ncbi:MAG: dTDP-glucose 4,6-dehydratase [Armatimonadota bacterium]|nr:dTDP-glucose 4,6-dehydratase [Armatimonadota bacterium]